jgi:hypothetical protein
VRRTVGEGLARAFASGRRVTGLGDQGYVVAP